MLAVSLETWSRNVLYLDIRSINQQEKQESFFEQTNDTCHTPNAVPSFLSKISEMSFTSIWMYNLLNSIFII